MTAFLRLSLPNEFRETIYTLPPSKPPHYPSLYPPPPTHNSQNLKIPTYKTTPKTTLLTPHKQQALEIGNPIWK